MTLFFRLMAGVFIAALAAFSVYAFLEMRSMRQGQQAMQEALQSQSQAIDTLSQKMLVVETKTEQLGVREEETYTKMTLSGVGLRTDFKSLDIISEKGLRIDRVIKNKPAWRAGLRADDFILAIDGQSVIGMKGGDALMRIRGKAGTSVSITYKSKADKETKSVSLTREDIEIKMRRTKGNWSEAEELWDATE